MTTRCTSFVFGLAVVAALAAPVGAHAQDPAPPSGEALRDLKTVEEAVHELKERVFRSKATLQLLSELVVEAVALDAKVSVWHVDDLGAAYDITGIRYFLDGRSIYEWSAADGTAAPPRELELRDQDAEVGPHTLQVSLDVKGGGGQVFRYLEDYGVTVQSSYSFDVEPGRRTLVFVHAQKEKGLKKGFLDKPGISYEIRTEPVSGDDR